jgi:putative ABC transport system ATP-binding protein
VKENDAGLVLVTHDENLAARCDNVYKVEDNSLKECP